LCSTCAIAAAAIIWYYFVTLTHSYFADLRLAAFAAAFLRCAVAAGLMLSLICFFFASLPCRAWFVFAAFTRFLLPYACYSLRASAMLICAPLCVAYYEAFSRRRCRQPFARRLMPLLRHILPSSMPARLSRLYILPP